MSTAMPPPRRSWLVNEWRLACARLFGRRHAANVFMHAGLGEFGFDIRGFTGSFLVISA
jgi:hypothetical protein